MAKGRPTLTVIAGDHEPDDDRPSVILMGNVVDGISVIGVFEDIDEAVEWADENIERDDWVAATMILKEEY